MDENKNIDPKLEAALKGIFNSLTDEQKEKAKQCKTMDELTAFAGKEGIELSDEVLDAIAGGLPTTVIPKATPHKVAMIKKPL